MQDDAMFLVDDGYVSERDMLIACLKFISADDINKMLEYFFKSGDCMQDYLDDAMFLVDDGYVSERDMLIACLKFMGGDDIRDMLAINGFDEGCEENIDIDLSESDEWNSYDPDC